MRRRAAAFLIVPLMCAAGCQAPPPAPPPPPDYRVTATIKDIMDSMIDPVADVIWNSVATTVTISGVEERRPRTDAEWATVRRAAITIIEATNLLIMPGREVAKAGQKSENPGIELEPDEIAKLLKDQPDLWVKQAHALHDAAVETLTAIDARNVEGMMDSGEKLDEACEACHLDHWYPSGKKPAVPTSMKK